MRTAAPGRHSDKASHGSYQKRADSFDQSIARFATSAIGIVSNTRSASGTFTVLQAMHRALNES